MILSHDAIQINNHLMSYNNSLIADHANIKPELDYYYATVWENSFSTAKNNAGLYNDWHATPYSHSFNIVCEFDNALNIDGTFKGLIENTLSSIMDSQSGEYTCFANVTAANSAFYNIGFSENILPQLFEKSSGFYSLREANYMFYANGDKWGNLGERYVINIPNNSFNKLRQADYMFYDGTKHDIHIGNNCFNAIGDLSATLFSPHCDIEIGDNCFNSVSSVSDTDIFGSDSLSAIGDNCFNGLTAINGKFIPNGTRFISIGNSFKNLKTAQSAFMMEHGTTAFFDLRNLNLLENGNHMFDGDGYYKQMLETTHLPSLTAGNRMFQYCQNLSGDVSAFIQANSARIVEHDGMFRGCERLNNYYQLKDNPEYSAWF